MGRSLERSLGRLLGRREETVRSEAPLMIKIFKREVRVRSVTIFGVAKSWK